MLSPKRLQEPPAPVRPQLAKRSEKLDHAERWLRDGLEVCQPPAFFEAVEVDMTRCRATLEEVRRSEGVKATYTHAIVRATALALAAHPDLHQIVCGGMRHFPEQIDIGLSVAGEAAVAPILIIESADRKSLCELAAETTTRVPQVQKADEAMLGLLRRWGWLVPTGRLRRMLLRLLWTQREFRYKGSGTFQVTCLPRVDLCVPSTFMTTGIVAAGAVRDRVIAVDGKPLVRPTLILTCSADHRVWDGRAAERFLGTMKAILESGDL